MDPVDHGVDGSDGVAATTHDGGIVAESAHNTRVAAGEY
jgi:hypothetical protein